MNSEFQQVSLDLILGLHESWGVIMKFVLLHYTISNTQIRQLSLANDLHASLSNPNLCILENKIKH